MPAWYYRSGSNQIGPIAEERFHELVSAGTVTSETLVWARGMKEWRPWSAVQATSASESPATAPIASTAGKPIRVDLLRDPQERTAFIVLCITGAFALFLGATWIIASAGAALVLLIPFILAILIRHGLAHAYFRVNAIEVSQKQFPEIYLVAANFCHRLQCPLPVMYVIQDSLWNAFAMRLLGTPVVVLHSMAVDSILLKGDARQLAFLIGHEIGHHHAGHLGWRHFIASWGAWFIWARLWWSRRCEFTCDRYGLACAGSLEAAQLAVCNMTVGAQLASRVNVDEAARQWESRKREFFVRYTAIYSTHPHSLNRLSALPMAASELGLPQR